MTPTIGRIVHYTLSEYDAQQIERQRPLVVDGRQVRNSAQAGDVFPALIVRTFDPSVSTVNLKILFDGEGEYWATSRQEGDGEGRWFWPPRV
ncbi:hypothetical protein [Nonomuraea dietziae]|uniref:hypothetical protein n=1 Tax=Nonomuraea dietziae TaxID=65515 RepID=UPI0033FEF0D4